MHLDPFFQAYLLRLLGRSNSELYLTFRGEGPGSELTSTNATQIWKLAEERPRPGWWVFVAETSYWFLQQKFIGLCTLPAVVTPELHPPAPAHLRGLPFTSFCTCYQTPHSDQVALLPHCGRKKQILLGYKLEDKTLKISGDYNGGLMCSWILFSSLCTSVFSLNICKILLLESHKKELSSI